MPIVKTVMVKLGVIGADGARAEMDSVAARAAAIGKMDPVIKVSADDRGALRTLSALRVEMGALKLAGDAGGLANLAAQLRAIGDNAESPRVKLAALRVELGALDTAAALAATATDEGTLAFERKNQALREDIAHLQLISGLEGQHARSLRLEADAAKVAADAIGGGGGGRAGFFGALSMLFGGGPAAAAGAPAAGGAAAAGGGTGILVGVTAGLAAMAAGLGGIVPMALSAGMGLVSFGALAYPVFSGIKSAMAATSTATDAYAQASLNLDQAIHKSPADLAAYRASLAGLEPDLRGAAKLLTDQNVTWQNLSPSMRASVVALADNKAALKGLLPDQKKALDALMAQKTAWDSLSPAQATAVTAIHGIGDAFSKMATAIQPLAFQVINDGLKGLNILLPNMLPFARAAGTAIDGLLKSFGKFAASPGFKQWMGQMAALAGPSITVIGEGIGKITVALGKLVIALMNPNALRAWKFLFSAIAATITGVAAVVTYATGNMIRNFHAIAVGFDSVRRFFAINGHEIAQAFDYVRHSFAIAGHDIAGTFDYVRHSFAILGHDIAVGFDNIRHWFASLPGIITRAVGNFGSLLAGAGRALISGLISGIQSMLGPLGSFLGGIASFIASHKGPLDADAVLLFPHGQAMMGGLMAGIGSRIPDLRSQLAQITAMTGGYGSPLAAGASGAGTGGGQLTVRYVGSGNALVDELVKALRYEIRTAGGGSVQGHLGWGA